MKNCSLKLRHLTRKTTVSVFPQPLRRETPVRLVCWKPGHLSASPWWSPRHCEVSVSVTFTFSNQGPKSIGAYYRDVVFEIHPGIWKGVFRLSAAHCAKDAVALLEQETPDFIPPTLWSPNNSPVDYNVWSVLQQRVIQRIQQTLPRSLMSIVDERKRRIKNEWADLNQSCWYWTCCNCWRLALASTCLRSCWRRTFRAYNYDVKMMWLTTHLTIFERQ